MFQFQSNSLHQRSQELYLEGYNKKKMEKNGSLIHMIDKKEVVGKGGFGKVYRVEVKGSGKSLALK